MSQNMRQVVKNDNDLMKLLSIVDSFMKDKNGEINLSNIKEICAKITTIDTTNPKSYSRRTAWTVTGRLLIGLTTYYELQVQIVLDESRRLYESCRHRNIFVERTKTTKRKIKQAIQTTQTKSKKKRTVQTEVEEETVAQVKFWEEPLRLEKNSKLSKDVNLVPADQITLREINEPSIESNDEEVDYSFGDEGQCFDFDDDVDMAAEIQTVQRAITFDENMNDISNDAAPETDQEMTAIEFVQQPDYGSDASDANADVDLEMEEVSDIVPSLLKNLTPLQSVVFASPKTPKKKRRSTSDKDTYIPSKIMQRRISNVFVNCIKRSRVVNPVKKQLQLSKAAIENLFSNPITKGSCTHEIFKRNATIEPMETDWAIIKDVFAPVERDEPMNDTQNASIEMDVLRNESESQIQTRRQHRNSINILAPVDRSRASTPSQSPSHQSFRCSTPHPINPNIIAKPHTADSLLYFLDVVFTPPSEFNTNSSIPPPVDLDDNISNQLELSNSSSRRSLRSVRAIVPETDHKETPTVQCSDLVDLLGEQSSEYTIILKLMNLWRKEMHPIKVEHLLTQNSNRFQAAKTFSSLLILKKKSLVHLENAADGKITHIGKGDGLKLDG